MQLGIIIIDRFFTALLRSAIDKEFNFSDYLEAISRLKEKGRRGRIILNW